MNNTLLLSDCIDEFKSKNSLNLKNDDIFELFSLFQITKKLNLTYDDIETAIVDGGKDGGIDVFFILLDDCPINSEDEIDQFEFDENSSLKVLIGQCKNGNSFKEDIVDKIFITIDRLFNLDVQIEDLNSEFNDHVVEKTDWFRKVWRKATRKGASITIDYFYSCIANEINESDNFRRKKNQILEKTNSLIHNSKSTFDIYSSCELLKFYYSKPEEEIALKLKELPLSVNYRDGSIGYIGVAQIPDYLSFVKDEDGVLRETIFEENVRHYQGDVDVNKKIQTTLNGDFERDFWWLNNGITIIASDVRQHHKELTLKGVQIVNGLQTSYTIGKHYESVNTDDRSVLIKIIKCTDKSTIDNIISATNRQTAINPALLRATDDIQRKIELFFEQKGYFYDRRKNFYKNQGKSASKIFSIQATAQAIHSIINFKPDEARSKPTTLIKTPESYENIFKKDISFEVFFNCCLISRKVTDYIKTVIIEKSEKSLARMFSHHIFRIVPSLILENSHCSSSNIKDLDIELVNKTVINESFLFVKNCIDEFIKESKTQNINSISKSGLFADFLSKQLIAQYVQT